MWLRINGAPFAAKYVRMMLALPGLQVNGTNGKIKESPIPVLRFIFDGGEGCLMPRGKPNQTHIEASIEQ
jgi:hypothetical protein